MASDCCPATPTWIDIGGRRLAMWDAGTGTPTVVLETGLGLGGAPYAEIARRIAAFTRVVWYDRAGLGASDPAPTPRTVEDLAVDLHTLLQRARISGPFVLAGHSLGGLTVRFYRERYPAEVAALVLIDSSHEAQRARFLALLPPEQADEPSALARLRRAFGPGWTDPAHNAEQIDNVANSGLLRTCGPLGDTRLAVISRGKPPPRPADYPAELGAQIEQTWEQMQRELARLSTRSRHIRAAHSGHLINEDAPDLLVAIIRQTVMELREQMRQ